MKLQPQDNVKSNFVYNEMIGMADNVIAVKNLVKVKSKRKNKVATFMPKPIFGDNASAMAHIKVFGMEIQMSCMIKMIMLLK